MSACIFPEASWVESQPESQGIESDKVTLAMKYMADFCGDQGSSQAIVVKNGHVIWRGSDTHNLHQVWSCTKSFLSICFGILQADGKISLDHYVKDYLPDLADDYPEVRLRHLGTFLGGISNSREEPFQAGAPRYQPGTAYHYCQEPEILAYACTKVADEPLKDLFMRRVARPIGIRDDQFDWGIIDRPGPDGIPVNGGTGMPERNVKITADAMARIGWLLANNGNWNGQQLIDADYLAFATENKWDYPNVPMYDPEGWYQCLVNSYGYYFWVNGLRPNGVRMWPHAPAETYALQGNCNNFCMVIPSWKMVIVRLGTDQIKDTDLYDGVVMSLASGTKNLSKLAKVTD